MTRRHDPTSPKHWAGGHYELALQVSPADDDQLGEWVIALVEAVGMSDTAVVDGTGHAPDLGDHTGARRAGAAIAQGRRLRGLVGLPGGAPSTCGLMLMTLRDVFDGALDGEGDPRTAPRDDATDPDWLVLFLPLAGLVAAGVAVGGFPFDDRSGVESLAWRRPLDEWLASVGRAVRTTIPFRRAVIGFEVAGDDDSDAPGQPPSAPRDRAHLVVGPHGLTHIPAER